jgi:hypothetical protein
MAFGDEGIAVGCDRHRCRLSKTSRPCRLGLPCPAPSAPCRPAKGHHLHTFAGRGSASDHPDIAVSTGYDVMGKTNRRRRNFSSPSRSRTVPQIGATLEPAQPLSFTAIEHPNMVFWRDIHVVRGPPRTRYVSLCIHPMTGVGCVVDAKKPLALVASRSIRSRPRGLLPVVCSSYSS